MDKLNKKLSSNRNMIGHQTPLNIQAINTPSLSKFHKGTTHQEYQHVVTSNHDTMNIQEGSKKVLEPPKANHKQDSKSPKQMLSLIKQRQKSPYLEQTGTPDTVKLTHVKYENNMPLQLTNSIQYVSNISSRLSPSIATPASIR